MESCNRQPKSNDDRRRGISNLNCVSTCTILGIGATVEEIERLLLPQVCPLVAMTIHADRGALLQVAHISAHQPNGFSREISRLFDDKYREQITWVAQQPSEGLMEQIDELPPESVELPGIIWGLLTHPDPTKRTIGERYVHNTMQRGFAAVRPGASRDDESADAPAAAAPDSATANLSHCELRSKVAEQAETIERMLDYINRTRPQEVINHA